MIGVGKRRRGVERIGKGMASDGRLDSLVGMREWRCRGDERGASHPWVAVEAGVETLGALVLEMTGGRPQRCWIGAHVRNVSEAQMTAPHWMAFVLALAGSWIGNE